MTEVRSILKLPPPPASVFAGGARMKGMSGRFSGSGSGSISTPKAKVKRKSVISDMGSYINKRGKSLFRNKQATTEEVKKQFRFNEMVDVANDVYKQRVKAPEEYSPMEVDTSEFGHVDADDLEYDFTRLIMLSVEQLNQKLFESLILHYEEEFIDAIDTRQLEAILSKAMLSDDLAFAQMVLNFALAHEEYEGFKVASDAFYGNRTLGKQSVFLSLVRQGNITMVQMALRNGYGNADALSAIKVNNGDMIKSAWLDPRSDKSTLNKKPGKKKKKKKDFKLPKKETKRDKRLDRMLKVHIKSTEYEAETVLTAALRQDNEEMLVLLMDNGARAEDNDYLVYRLAARYAQVEYISLFLERLRNQSDVDSLVGIYEEIFTILFVEASIERRMDVIQWTYSQLQEDPELAEVDVLKVLHEALQYMYKIGEEPACTLRYRLMHGIVLLLRVKEEVANTRHYSSKVGFVTPRQLHHWFLSLLDRNEYKGYDLMLTLFSLGLGPFLADAAHREEYIKPSREYFPTHQTTLSLEMPAFAPRSKEHNKKKRGSRMPAAASKLMTMAGGAQSRKANFKDRELAITTATKSNQVEILQKILSLIDLPDSYYLSLMVMSARHNAAAVTKHLMDTSFRRAEQAKLATGMDTRRPSRRNRLTRGSFSGMPQAAAQNVRRASRRGSRRNSTFQSAAEKLAKRKSSTVGGRLSRRISMLSVTKAEKREREAQDDDDDVFTQGKDQEMTLEDYLSKAFEVALHHEAIDSARIIYENGLHKIKEAVTRFGEVLVAAVTTHKKFPERFLSELLQMMRDHCDEHEFLFLSKLLSHHANTDPIRNHTNLDIIFQGTRESLNGAISAEDIFEAMMTNREPRVRPEPIQEPLPMAKAKKNGSSFRGLGRKFGSGTQNNKSARKIRSGPIVKKTISRASKKRKAKPVKPVEVEEEPPKVVSEHLDTESDDQDSEKNTDEDMLVSQLIAKDFEKNDGEDGVFKYNPEHLDEDSTSNVVLENGQSNEKEEESDDEDDSEDTIVFMRD